MKPRILAVDDEPAMLRLLERIITEKTSYRIATTNNSLEVPELLEQHEYDLIISDLKMPGMDGIDILKHVRENNRREEVIIMTAFGTLDSATEALQMGVFHYITKPFKKEQIIIAVERALELQTIRRDARVAAEMFKAEPYEQARTMFEREYIRKLAERADGDIQAMARRSGLPVELIKEAMQDA